MDSILNCLPDNVHVRFGWEHEPQYFNGIPHTEYKIIIIPKSWLKHGDRGSYNEWSIKENYKRKLIKLYGDEFGHYTESIEVLEWNQMENIAYMLRQAKNINFTDILERVTKIEDEDIIYTHSVGI